MTTPCRALLPLDYSNKLSTAEKFVRFHSNNPDIYRILVKLTREWVAQTGRRRLGVRALWERMRWQVAITTKTADFKLNDHYTSFYARLIEHQEPDLRGVFRLRKSEEADAWIAEVAE